jgi:hypothetical protein
MSASKTTMLVVLRRQMEPSLQMLADIVDACPESLWVDSRSGRPFWQQIVHALTGVRFWFRESSQLFSPPDFGQGPIPDLDQMPNFNADKQTVKSYLQTVRTTVETFFSSLDEERLLNSWPVYDK